MGYGDWYSFNSEGSTIIRVLWFDFHTCADCIRAGNFLVGHIKGGLGHINILVSMIMAGLSGSAAADTAAVGSTLIPAMVKEKYDAGFTVAITAASSTLGVIIPPSIMMVVYGAMAQVSIGKFF